MSHELHESHEYPPAVVGAPFRARPAFFLCVLLCFFVAIASAVAGPPPSGRVPERVRVIFAPATNETFSVRMNAVHALGKKISPEERDAACDYLRAPSDENAPGRQNENWLRNDIMDKLVEQDTPPAGLSDLLVGIYEDKEQDIVMRDYAVQHMTPAYAQCTANERAALRNALWNAVTEKDSSLAGTALIALHELSRDDSAVVGRVSTHGDFDRTQLAETALRLASDEQCGELSRITAVSVCGRLGVKQVAPIAAQLAQTAESIPLRIAAIAALGDMGGGGAKEVLEELAAGGKPRERRAAQSALDRVRAQRTAPNSPSQ